MWLVDVPWLGINLVAFIPHVFQNRKYFLHHPRDRIQYESNKTGDGLDTRNACQVNISCLKYLM